MPTHPELHIKGLNSKFNIHAQLHCITLSNPSCAVFSALEELAFLGDRSHKLTKRQVELAIASERELASHRVVCCVRDGYTERTFRRIFVNHSKIKSRIVFLGFL